jgi:hypothetical protein
MAAAANPADDPADLEALDRHAAALVQAVEVALPGWVQRAVATRWAEQHEDELPEPVQDAAREAAAAAVDEVLPPLRALLAEDVAEQRGNPLSLVRRAVVHPTRVLAAAGVVPLDRDDEARRLFPDDVYDLVPATFADLDESVLDPGVAWGAAKAHVLLRRRRTVDGRAGEVGG